MWACIHYEGVNVCPTYPAAFSLVQLVRDVSVLQVLRTTWWSLMFHQPGVVRSTLPYVYWLGRLSRSACIFIQPAIASFISFSLNYMLVFSFMSAHRRLWHSSCWIECCLSIVLLSSLRSVLHSVRAQSCCPGPEIQALYLMIDGEDKPSHLLLCLHAFACSCLQSVWMHFEFVVVRGCNRASSAWGHSMKLCVLTPAFCVTIPW